jgi:hypothetical protein
LAFFAFFTFFAFFAFFAFLAIASSQGLMDGNATRGMLGGGPTSQHPRMQSQQIREALPRAVMPVSWRYPQLLCVLARFFEKFARHARARGVGRRLQRCPVRVNDAQCAGACCIDPKQVRAVFINSKPQRGSLPRGESPLSRVVAFYC